MSNFITNTPLSGDIPSQTVLQTQTNWIAMKNWIELEHGPFSWNASAGAHLQGKTGVLFYGTSAQIGALIVPGITYPGSGALAWSSDEGVLKIYDPAYGWNRTTWLEFSRLRRILPIPTIIPGDGVWHNIPLGGSIPFKTYDGLAEWTNYKQTIKDAGYYYLTLQIVWQATVGEHFIKVAALAKNGVGLSYSTIFGGEESTCLVTDIQYLSANDYIEAYAFQGRTDVGNGTDLTMVAEMHVSRLS